MMHNKHGIPVLAVNKKGSAAIPFNFTQNRRHAEVATAEFKRWYSGAQYSSESKPTKRRSTKHESL
jgi:hypothetical protein